MNMPGNEENGSFPDTPFFSIITVVRNNLDGLRATQKSLAEQVCDEFEWVVIDGASTDGSREFAITFAGPRVRVVSEPDRGIYDAMNKGLRLARGKYVIFMNSGDRLAAPTALSEVMAECVASDPDVLYCSSTMRFSVATFPRKARSPRYIWHGQPGLHQATIFRRACHLRFFYDQTFRICADYDVITRMAAAGLQMRSAPILVSENEFVASANSGRHKIELIFEAARIQRRNLRLNPMIIAVSFLRRCVSELIAKTLTLADWHHAIG